ncbi:hypothetical protein AGMMS50225_11290 [Betaproteobacteria bacterium]|nr:hypothetical protein AGMMS50225_11290 [Betaproteobacteria bacterium]
MRHSFPGNAEFWLALAVAATLGMGLLNVAWGIHSANSALIMLIAFAGLQWLTKTGIKLPAGPLARLTPCTLEIYLIHGYLFIGHDWHTPFAYLSSMALIVVVAFVLNLLLTKLKRKT